MDEPRTAIVTGSARRVGRAIADALVADGWRVLFHAREAERAREACEAAGGAGWVGADLMGTEAADEIAAAARAAFGSEAGLDLLVNSASSFEQVPRWEDAGVDGWQRAMAVNARAPYLLTVALLPMLRAARGLVLNVSDIAAHEHWPAFPIHSASKAALESLTLSGAAALRPDGVRMVAVAPGTILAPDTWSPERIVQEAAAGKLGSPDELIRTICELAGDPTRTGEVIPLCVRVESDRAGIVNVMTTSTIAPPEHFVAVHNHGHVHLEDSMGTDLHIVNNARVSFDQESTEFTPKERGLLNFLMRERHGSPWESVVFRFDVKAPIFVIREWQRHRVGSFNEQSARYSVVPDHYYVPDADYLRQQVGSPGKYSFEPIEDEDIARSSIDLIDSTQRAAFDAYNQMLEQGIAKELARTVLPVGMFSRMKWTVNLRALFNFLSLRNDEHAQREIRDYAIAVEQLAKDVVPVAFEVFEENGRVCP